MPPIYIAYLNRLDIDELKITESSPGVAQVFLPAVFTIGPPASGASSC